MICGPWCCQGPAAAWMYLWNFLLWLCKDAVCLVLLCRGGIPVTTELARSSLIFGSLTFFIHKVQMHCSPCGISRGSVEKDFVEKCPVTCELGTGHGTFRLLSPDPHATPGQGQCREPGNWQQGPSWCPRNLGHFGAAFWCWQPAMSELATPLLPVHLCQQGRPQPPAREMQVRQTVGAGVLCIY